MRSHCGARSPLAFWPPAVIPPDSAVRGWSRGDCQNAGGAPNSAGLGFYSLPVTPFGTALLKFPQTSQALQILERMAPQVGLEPTTLRLTAGCSAIELLRSVGCCARREPASESRGARHFIYILYFAGWRG